MAKLKLNSFMKRAITALIMLFFAVFILYQGTPLIELCSFLIGILLAYEWATIVPNKNKSLYMNSYIFALGSCLLFQNYWTLGVVALTTIFVFLKSKGEEKRKLLTLGAVYISVGVASLVWLYQGAGLLVFVWVLVAVWGMDIGGYVVGSTLKGPKLMPKVSPNKTYAGLFGGLLFAGLFSAALMYVVDIPVNVAEFTPEEYKEYISERNTVYALFVIIGMIIGFISQIGDLIESAIKRNVGVKDSSNLIPGHGGVFDRFDALIFVAPFAYVAFIFAAMYF